MMGSTQYEAAKKFYFQHMMEQAEQILIQRRLRMRHKSIANIKEMIGKKHDFQIKTQKINRLIDTEFTYFGVAHKEYKKIAEIQQMVKNNEAALK